MKDSHLSRRAITTWIVAAATAGALALYGHGRNAGIAPGDPQAKGGPALETVGMSVRVTTPTTTTFERAIAATGTVNARDELIIGSDAAGIRLVEVLVDVGCVVRKGQLLARGDDTLLLAQLAQQTALVRQAEAEAVQANDKLERAERLKGTGVYSLETVQARHTAALAAAARLDLAVAQRQEMQVKLAHTRIVAPAAGVISRRSATVGAVVQAGPELFRLIRDGELEWRAELPGHSLAMVETGSPVRIQRDDGRTIEARVRLVAPTIDPATRNGQVHVMLPRTVALKAGAHARGEILIANTQALAIPEASVLSRDGYSYVYLVGTDAIARLARIETGSRRLGMVEVRAGLKPDTRVVTTGAGFVKDGELVRIAPVQPIDTAGSESGTNPGGGQS